MVYIDQMFPDIMSLLTTFTFQISGYNIAIIDDFIASNFSLYNKNYLQYFI